MDPAFTATACRGATTAASIGPRLSAAFLQRTRLEPDRWAVLCGWATDDFGAGPVEELLAGLPQLNRRRAHADCRTAAVPLLVRGTGLSS